jgi:hypothetical protein
MEFKNYDHTEKKPKNTNPFLPQHPYSMLVSAPTGGGKTLWTINLLLDKASPFDQIHVFYAMPQPKYKILQSKLKARGVTVEFTQGLPEDEEATMDKLRDNAEKGLQTCLLIDDLMTEGGKSTFVNRLHTAGSHHLNLSVICLSQLAFASRHQRLQVSYLVLFAFEQDKSALAPLARQIMPENTAMWMAMYEQAISSRPHGWFMVDFKANRAGTPALKYRDSSFVRVFQPGKIV